MGREEAGLSESGILPLMRQKVQSLNRDWTIVDVESLKKAFAPNLSTSLTRPSFDEFLCVLDDNIDWMGPNLFNGADPELIASSLTMAADLSELSQVLYMEGEQEKLFIAALDAISNGDKKALVDMGMPAKSWHKDENDDGDDHDDDDKEDGKRCNNDGDHDYDRGDHHDDKYDDDYVEEVC
ncbi:hypothetical protein RRG08_030839 [Elysia crispata]|uniref:Uncharacterized protein n=1 Tax=Elysia crispata TaxID=231223 RepID=A0AAE0XSU5_9GAST|nr:hypothetical protein RRG08_030839 [Elysia crispata]